MAQDPKLIQMATDVSKKAYSPYSGAQVGCAILGAGGGIYTGCNVENSSYGATICAERAAVFSAVSHGERSFAAVYLYSKDGWYPCGMCRQVLREFGEPSLPVIILSAQGVVEETTLAALLPRSFGPEQLQELQKSP
jgi:cytidine deaminase